MNIIGIICEYNPFHNGHLYHIKKVKEMYPNSLIILIMSGYFTERGEVSIVNKINKTKIALSHYIDLVVELPIMYSSQAADTFAYRSIEILNHLKIDTLVFGSESNNIELLTKIANIQLNDQDYQTRVKNYLDQGLNYPTSLAKALDLEGISYTPNDLLGISYVKAILKINKNINPITIKRTNDYHDIKSNDDIISASNIRNKLKQNEDITKYVPKNTTKYITKYSENTLFKLLKYKINTDDELYRYLTVDEGIENRIYKVINNVTNIEDLIMNIKTKRYTYNKISRMLLHILLSYRKYDALDNLEYIKILGFNTIGKSYLNKIKKDINISLKPILNTKQFNYELRATQIYDLITNEENIIFEKSTKPIYKE